MRRINQIFWIIFCLCLFSLAAAAQTSTSALPKADPRVAKALKDVNTDFEISSKDGDYKVTYGTKKNRKQTGFISSTTEEIFGVEMRLIFSFAMISNNLPSQQTANLLLQENMKINGGWAIQKMDDGQYAILNKIYIPADFTGENLESALQTVIVLADEMEERLTKKDEY